MALKLTKTMKNVGLGALAVIGANRPANLVHILLNNRAHESVGGMPTVSAAVDWPGVARACSYSTAETAEDYDRLEQLLRAVRAERRLAFLEVRCGIGSRKDLGRPTTTPQENKMVLMSCLEED